jgi:transcriptional regulator with XRE-family HTH domain
MTLEDVARRLGVGRQAIYKYENGTVTNIPLENLEIMAQLFGTTPGYLAGWDDTLPPGPPPDTPHTPEARILAAGIDKLPQEQREQALNVVRAMFAKYSDYFEEDDNHDA